DIAGDEAVSVEAGADAAHLRTVETALARLDTEGNKIQFTEVLSECMKDKKYDNTEYIIISNYRKQDLVDMYGGLRNAGINISWIIPEYRIVEPKLTQQGDKNIVKWTVSDAR
ncbi:MAG: hypothetical protein IKP31_03035, partial [Lachnospiraceae bacterium]|nr:hypothetical protein [Lachnospiraceae bacterium]